MRCISRPPILLIHGDQDDVVPIASLPEAADGLQKAGFQDVFAHVQKGTAHGIASDGLSVALAFMRDQAGAVTLFLTLSPSRAAIALCVN
jgi:phospholipase/carboxylesterase